MPKNKEKVKITRTEKTYQCMVKRKGDLHGMVYVKLYVVCDTPELQEKVFNDFDLGINRISAFQGR